MRAAVPLVILLSTAVIARAQETPSYNRDVRPILSDRCFPCHGPDRESRKGSLRLDLRDHAIATDGTRLPAVTPKHPGQSAAFLRMTHDEPGRRMPPPASKLTITKSEIAILERWIAAGAPYEAHWAFVPPEGREPPGDAGGWGRDPLDRFIEERLEAADLSPSPEADRATLLRRVTFDLTGLPPSLEEIDAFLSDQRNDAFARVVDRLLASNRFGERMAADWLDVARYADTFGYQSDVYREVWPWRDWVIRAFNDNLPYDQFLTWQIAGDLIPKATRDQKLATAFNRLHRQTNEGGSVEEEYRQEYIGDRVHTMGTAFMGLTLECARCHDHKFDPISQREYYGLAAYFANIDESGLYSHFTRATPTPALDLPSPGQSKTIASLEQKVDAAERARDQLRPRRRAAFKAWRDKQDPVLAIPDRTAAFTFERFEPKRRLANAQDAAKPGATSDSPRLVEGHSGKGLLLSGENNAHFPGVAAVTRHDPFSISLWIEIPELRERMVILHRSRAWTDAGSQGYELLIEDGRLKWSLIHFWPGNAVSIKAAVPAPVGRWTHVVVTHDGSARATGLHLFVDGKKQAVSVEKDHLTRSITGGGGLRLTLGQRFRDKGFKGGRVDDLQVFARSLHDREVTALRTAGPLAVSDDARSFQWWLDAIDPEYRKAIASVTAARKELAKVRDRVRSIMTMSELPRRRPTHLLERGAYDRRGEPVGPELPAALPEPEQVPVNRLGLARWLTGDDHPLTARVAVNRLWQTVFGRGLVSTPDNFGTQGVAPSHPELLDHLATDFVRGGWDVKAMIRRLVMSSTYRQSGRLRADGQARDPDNTLLWHGPVKRLTSEMLRDQALFASGLLDNTIGGPPVKPYQPAGLWKEKSGQTYRRDKGAGLYRRSLYTFWKRTSPPPSMMILDGAKRDVCVAHRHVTNTPLQALLLLNDPQFVEAARVLAARVLAREEATDGRIRQSFRVLTGRTPRPAEQRALTALFAAQRARYVKAPDDAKRLLAVGDVKAPEGIDPADVAALATVCSTILISDAAVTTR